MRNRNLVLQLQRLLVHASKSKSKVHQVSLSSLSTISQDVNNIREKIAPWIRIGEFKSGLLSHLSTCDIVRALFVLRICSIDWIVERSLPVKKKHS